MAGEIKSGEETLIGNATKRTVFFWGLVGLFPEERPLLSRYHLLPASQRLNHSGHQVK
jgi:hypothetical protein